MDNAFRYIKANDGIDTEESYPYEAKDGQCRFQRAYVGATVTGKVSRPLDSRARTTTRFYLKFFALIVKKWTPRNSSLYFFSPERLVLLLLLKEVEPFPNCKMLKPLTFHDLFPPLRHSR